MVEVPMQFRGRWSGLVKDINRVNPYRGELVLNEKGGNTRYVMRQQVVTGVLSDPEVVGGFLILKESTTNRSGPGNLLGYLDGEGSLRCVWNVNSKFSGEAVMSRPEGDGDGNG